VGGRLAAASGDPRETSILWQHISVLIQRFNAVLIGETFLHPDEAPDLYSSHSKRLFLVFDLSPLVLYTLSIKN